MKKILFIILCFVVTTVAAQTPAFPGAEGFGKYTTGGRGGRVITVTNLNDSGDGSLRWALGKEGARIIVFAVSGYIDLQRSLDINKGNVTIAGQTAPGEGICLRNYGIKVKSDNVIIRYLRCRPGAGSEGGQDAFTAIGRKNVIIDHCSFSWSNDETATAYDNTNFTMQWCLISESLNASTHVKGSHGYGGIWGGKNASFHHNMMANHSSRTPRLCGSRFSGDPKNEFVDIRNNVFYNWGPKNGMYGAEGGRYNIVNNYFKPGASTNTKRALVSAIINPNFDDGSKLNKKGEWGKFYIAGNYFDGTSPYLKVDYQENIAAVNEDNWKGVIFRDTTENWNGISTIYADKEYPVKGNIETQRADSAYAAVLASVGASLVRDVVDMRVISDTKAGIFSITGSHGSSNGLIDTPEDAGDWHVFQEVEAPTDTDKDGMPDEWEEANGLNPNENDSSKKSLSAEYTNIEVYMNGLVEITIPN